MSFRKLCHMPFRKLIFPFTLTVYKLAAHSSTRSLPYKGMHLVNNATPTLLITDSADVLKFNISLGVASKTQ